MSELPCVTFIEQDPRLYLEIGASNDYYSRLAVDYNAHIDDIMQVITSEMMKTSATPDRQKDTYDTITWRMDGDITDGRFDFALRMAARVKAPSDPNEVPAGIMGGKRYTPTSKWNGKATNLSNEGLYLLGLECRTVETHQLTPGQLFMSYPKQTHFTHELESGDVRYRADATEDPGTSLGPLPSHEAIVKNAYDQFIVEHALATIDRDTTNSFAEAARADAEAESSSGPSDKLNTYRQLERDAPEVSQNIRPLARALYDANGNIFAPDMLNRLALDPLIAETAKLALLNKGSYGAESFNQQNRNLWQRLAWTTKVDSDLAAKLRQRMQQDPEGLAGKLDIAMKRIERIVQIAGAMSVALRPPLTVSIPSKHWITIAR